VEWIYSQTRNDLHLLVQTEGKEESTPNGGTQAEPYYTGGIDQSLRVAGGGPPAVFDDGAGNVWFFDGVNNIVWDRTFAHGGSLDRRGTNWLPPGIDPAVITLVKFVDLDGSGSATEMVVGTNAGAYVLTDGNPAGGDMSSATVTPVSDTMGHITDVEVIDVNGDGTRDIVVGADLETVKVYLGDATRPKDYSLTRHRELDTQVFASPRVSVASNGLIYVSTSAFGETTRVFTPPYAAGTGDTVPITASFHVTAVASEYQNGHQYTAIATERSLEPGAVTSGGLILVVDDFGASYTVDTTSISPGSDLMDVIAIDLDEDSLIDFVFVEKGTNGRIGMAMINPGVASQIWTQLQIGGADSPYEHVVSMYPDLIKPDGSGSAARELLFRTEGGELVSIEKDTATGLWSTNSPAYLNQGHERVLMEYEISDGLGAAGDLNGDGLLDLVSGALVVHGGGSGTDSNGFDVHRHRWWKGGPLPTRVKMFDVDRDNDLDLIAVSGDTNGAKSVIVYLNPGNGIFTNAETVALPNLVSTAYSDANAEIAVYYDEAREKNVVFTWTDPRHNPDRGTTMRWLEYDPLSASEMTTNTATDSGIADVHHVEVNVDLDNDNRFNDYAVVYGDNIALYDGDSHALLGTINEAGAITEMKSVAFGDITGDGFIDLVFVHTAGIRYITHPGYGAPTDTLLYTGTSQQFGAEWTSDDRMPSSLRVKDVDGVRSRKTRTHHPHNYTTVRSLQSRRARRMDLTMCTSLTMEASEAAQRASAPSTTSTETPTWPRSPTPRCSRSARTGSTSSTPTLSTSTRTGC
jgi:hypothetical protein